MISIISFVLASSSMSESDPYPGNLPKPFEKEAILFTASALQRMDRQKVSPEEVIKISQEHPNESFVQQNNLSFLFEGSPSSGKRKLIGIW